ncbi:MAG: sigma-70 family RNA polymerase sigma factor [Spartobacteria bacterium]
MNSSEHDLYRAVIHGDREAFEMIIRSQSRALFAIAYGVLQNREEAEDAVQDALVKAWKTRWRVRDPEKFSAWMATIARHRARDVARRRRTVPFPSEATEPIDPGNEEAVRAAQASEVNEQVQAALSTLPELHRTALTLRYFEAMDYAAIERTLGLSNGALRGILGRAMETMRKRLRPALATLK